MNKTGRILLKADQSLAMHMHFMEKNTDQTFMEILWANIIYSGGFLQIRPWTKLLMI